MPRWRKSTWALLVWTGLMVLWHVSGYRAGTPNCEGKLGEDLAYCQQGAFAEYEITVAAIWLMWLIGFIVLGLVRIRNRPRSGRSEPAH